MNENFTEKPLRPDAESIRWLKSKKAWYGIYHEFRTKHDPPMAMLTDWVEAPKKELSRLREIKKAEVAQRLGLHLTRDYLLSTLKEKYLKGVPVKKTRDDYERTLRYLEQACGEVDLRSWGEEHETQFTDSLRTRGLKPGGINKYQRQLQWFLNWITNKRIVPGFNYWRITKEAVEPWVIEVFTREELEDYKRQVFDYGNPIFIRAWMLAYYAIMRAEEIVTLLTSRIILKTGKIQISKLEKENHGISWHPKAHIQRYMGIHPELNKFLVKDLEDYPRKWYLDNNGKQHYTDKDNLSQAFTRLRDKRFKWERKIDMLQALRRTGITHMIESGIMKDDVRYLAGHQNTSTTDKYYLFIDKHRATKNLNF